MPGRPAGGAAARVLQLCPPPTTRNHLLACGALLAGYGHHVLLAPQSAGCDRIPPPFAATTSCVWDSRPIVHVNEVFNSFYRRWWVACAGASWAGGGAWHPFVRLRKPAAWSQLPVRCLAAGCCWEGCAHRQRGAAHTSGGGCTVGVMAAPAWRCVAGLGWAGLGWGSQGQELKAAEQPGRVACSHLASDPRRCPVTPCCLRRRDLYARVVRMGYNVLSLDSGWLPAALVWAWLLPSLQACPHAVLLSLCLEAHSLNLTTGRRAAHTHFVALNRAESKAAVEQHGCFFLSWRRYHDGGGLLFLRQVAAILPLPCPVHDGW